MKDDPEFIIMAIGITLMVLGGFAGIAYDSYLDYQLKLEAIKAGTSLEELQYKN